MTGPLPVAGDVAMAATRSSSVVRREAGIRPSRSRPGFTLVELLTTLLIVGLLAGLLVGVAGYAKGKARGTRARADLERIQGKLQDYLLDQGRYPDALADLPAPWPTGLRRDATGAPLDPWGAPYRYAVTGPRAFRLYSLGPDGQEGTSAKDADNVVAGQ
jgi:type II secretion system protein G